MNIDNAVGVGVSSFILAVPVTKTVIDVVDVDGTVWIVHVEPTNVSGAWQPERESKYCGDHHHYHTNAGLPIEDEDGHTIDFHSLRATFGDLLIQQGVPIPTVARLMRHSDGGALLLKRYARPSTETAVDLPYVSRQGSRPMSIVWELETPMPTRLRIQASMVMTG